MKFGSYQVNEQVVNDYRDPRKSSQQQGKATNQPIRIGESPEVLGGNGTRYF